jgi:hypothetical protein
MDQNPGPLRLAEVRKSNFGGPQLFIRNFFSLYFRTRLVCPKYCGRLTKILHVCLSGSRTTDVSGNGHYQTMCYQ